MDIYTRDYPDDPITVLTPEESWDLLGTGTLGRLVFYADGRVEIFLVNYVTDQGKIVFRTAEGTKLAALTVNDTVAFEADHASPEAGWSVIVHGTARQLQTSREINEADTLPLRSWVPTPKYNYVEITPAEISGRRMLLERPE